MIPGPLNALFRQNGGMVLPGMSVFFGPWLIRFGALAQSQARDTEHKERELEA